ncbi:MAG: hypothetical protein ACFCU6_04415 [Balneolaceae bacterium]
MQIIKTLTGRFGSRQKHYAETTIAGTKKRSPFYLLITIAISVTAFWGFTYTYFAPVLAGTYPEVSPAIHIHGWSFFFWYLLLPLQAFLMKTGRRSIHMTLGSASLVLAAVMVFTGVLVASVRIEHALSATEVNEFVTLWAYFGQLIMYNMMLFTIFYVAAIAWRKQPAVHKRMIILASAGALPAAIFRIIVGLGDLNWLATPGWVWPAAFFLPALFILVAMAHDRIVKGLVHRAYIIGLTILLALHGFGLITAGTAVGGAISRFMALFAKAFGFLY